MSQLNPKKQILGQMCTFDGTRGNPEKVFSKNSQRFRNWHQRFEVVDHERKFRGFLWQLLENSMEWMPHVEECLQQEQSSITTTESVGGIIKKAYRAIC